MTKFILHGGFTSIDNELNRGFYKELSKGVLDNGTVLLIYFSRKSEDVDRLFEEDKNHILEQAGDKELNIILATEDDFTNEVNRADSLYMRGGDTDKLIATLERSPSFRELVKGKIVAGSSAGAYAIGRYSAGYSVKNVRDGLGLVPLRVICHYESTSLPPSAESVSMLKDIAPELELVVLRDCEWKTFVI